MTLIEDSKVTDLAFAILESQKPRKRIPYAGAVYGAAEIKATLNAVIDSFTTGWFAAGSKVREFEQKFAQWLGVEGAVFTNSGSSANLLAVGALVERGELCWGDEVITPATTFPTTINAMLMYGLKPVLVDVDLPTYTISLDTIKNAMSGKTAAIYPVHLCGSASDMAEIMRFASDNDLFVIEDTCDALGTTIYPKGYAGTYGDIGTFSFYIAHHMTTGEGGALVSNDKEILETARSLRDWGRYSGVQVTHAQSIRNVELTPNDSGLPEDYEARYSFVTRGFNLKPIEIQAAIGLVQIDRLRDFGQKRRANYAHLYNGLEPFTKDLILPESLGGSYVSWWAFPITIRPESKIKRQDLTNHLENDGIETRPLLAGDIRKQPAFAPVHFRVPEKLSNTETILKNTFFVGVYPGLGADDMDKIIVSFQRFFDGRH